MNEKEGLNILDFLATGINKTNPTIQAVLSNDEGEGAIANEIESVVDFINYYTKTNDVRDHYGYTLEMIAKLFAKLRWRVAEPDAIYLRRMLALTERKGDTVWGTALNMKHVFEMYFSGVTVFVAENTNTENILHNGDFEEDEYWQSGGGASYTYNARFSGRRGLFFEGISGQYCFQELDRSLPAGVYVFHFFLKGKCGLRIMNESGQYWNANDQKCSGDAVLQWSDEDMVNIFYANEWKDVFCFVKFPSDARKIIFEFLSAEDESAFIDYARFFVKPVNPSYTLVVQYEGYSVATKTLHSGMTGEDPVTGVDYSRESDFDHSFIVGRVGAYRNEAYKTLFDIVRPCGIQAFSEFVEKIIVD
jgi:hypothetical protein